MQEQDNLEETITSDANTESTKVSKNEESTNSNQTLPTKVGVWSKIKAFFLREIKVTLTPRQQAFEDKLNEFLFQEITLGKKNSY